MSRHVKLLYPSSSDESFTTSSHSFDIYTNKKSIRPEYNVCSALTNKMKTKQTQQSLRNKVMDANFGTWKTRSSASLNSQTSCVGCNYGTHLSGERKKNKSIAADSTVTAKNKSIAEGHSFTAKNKSIAAGSTVTAKNKTIAADSTVTAKNKSIAADSTVTAKNKGIVADSTVTAKSKSIAEGHSFTAKNKSIAEGDSFTAPGIVEKMSCKPSRRPTSMCGSNKKLADNLLIERHTSMLSPLSSREKDVDKKHRKWPRRNDQFAVGWHVSSFSAYIEQVARDLQAQENERRENLLKKEDKEEAAQFVRRGVLLNRAQILRADWLRRNTVFSKESMCKDILYNFKGTVKQKEKGHETLEDQVERQAAVSERLSMPKRKHKGLKDMPVLKSTRRVYSQTSLASVAYESASSMSLPVRRTLCSKRKQKVIPSDTSQDTHEVKVIFDTGENEQIESALYPSTVITDNPLTAVKMAGSPRPKVEKPQFKKFRKIGAAGQPPIKLSEVSQCESVTKTVSTEVLVGKLQLDDSQMFSSECPSNGTPTSSIEAFESVSDYMLPLKECVSTMATDKSSVPSEPETISPSASESSETCEPRLCSAAKTKSSSDLTPIAECHPPRFRVQQQLNALPGVASSKSLQLNNFISPEPPADNRRLHNMSSQPIPAQKSSEKPDELPLQELGTPKCAKPFLPINDTLLSTASEKHAQKRVTSTRILSARRSSVPQSQQPRTTSVLPAACKPFIEEIRQSISSPFLETGAKRTTTVTQSNATSSPSQKPNTPGFRLVRQQAYQEVKPEGKPASSKPTLSETSSAMTHVIPTEQPTERHQLALHQALSEVSCTSTGQSTEGEELNLHPPYPPTEVSETFGCAFMPFLSSHIEAVHDEIPDVSSSDSSLSGSTESESESESTSFDSNTTSSSTYDTSSDDN